MQSIDNTPKTSSYPIQHECYICDSKCYKIFAAIHKDKEHKYICSTNCFDAYCSIKPTVQLMYNIEKQAWELKKIVIPDKQPSTYYATNKKWIIRFEPEKTVFNYLSFPTLDFTEVKDKFFKMKW